MDFFNKEVNELRKHNQHLQERLERFNSIDVVVKRLLRLLIINPYRRITRKAYKIHHQYDINYQNENFTPYNLSYKTTINNTAPVVLHLINNFKTGGASRIVVDLAENISDAYQHIVVTRYNPIPQNYKGIKVEEICHVPSNNEVQQLLKKYNPKIIHIHWSSKWSELSSNWQWHNSFFKVFENFNGKLIQNVNIPIVPFHFKKIKCEYVFVSDFVKNRYSFQNEFNQVIYPGSDFNLFKQEKNEALFSKNIGMVYRLDDHKLKKDSIEPFIEAVKIDPEIKVHIIGDGELKPYFEQRIKEENQQDNYTLYNYVSYNELPNIYKKFSMFIAPVYEESFGQVTPFAMNMGIPILGYDTGAISEILEDTSCLVEQGNYKLLGKLIAEKIINNNFLKEKSDTNLKRSNLFSLNQMITKYKLVYNK